MASALDDVELLGRLKAFDVSAEPFNRCPRIILTGDEEFGPSILVQERILVMSFDQRDTHQAMHALVASGVVERHAGAERAWWSATPAPNE